MHEAARQQAASFDDGELPHTLHQRLLLLLR
jgi:hypothetical protein